MSVPKTLYNTNFAKQDSEEPVTRENNHWQQPRDKRPRASICKDCRSPHAKRSTPPPCSWDTLSNFKHLDTIRCGYFQHITQDSCVSKVKLKNLKVIWSLPNTCESDNTHSSRSLREQMSLNLLGVLAVYHLYR